jgi:hypothetical protein
MKRDRQRHQCLHEVPFTSNPPVHHCEFEPIQAHDLLQLQIERWESLPIEQQAQVEVASNFAFFDAPLHLAEDLFCTGRERCSLTRYRTRKAMIDD